MLGTGMLGATVRMLTIVPSIAAVLNMFNNHRYEQHFNEQQRLEQEKNARAQAPSSTPTRIRATPRINTP